MFGLVSGKKYRALQQEVADLKVELDTSVKSITFQKDKEIENLRMQLAGRKTTVRKTTSARSKKSN